MKLDDGLWSAARDSRIFRAIFNKTWLIGSLLALSACAEGVPPFGTPAAAGTGGMSGMNGASGTSGMSGSGGSSGSGGRAGASGTSGGGSGASGSSGAGGTSGASGMGGTGGEVVPCDVMMCPDPPPPFPFVPAPAACCKDNGQCGAVDLFGACA